jgi:hypothetical protein
LKMGGGKLAEDDGDVADEDGQYRSINPAKLKNLH